MNFNLNDFINKNLEKNNNFSSFIKNIKNELNCYFERKNNQIDDKYKNYWDYQNTMEDNIAARSGLSRWSADVKYREKLNDAIDNTILKFSEMEGITIYRKQFPLIISYNDKKLEVKKYQNGKITEVKISPKNIFSALSNDDEIFEIERYNKIKIRNDLKEKIIDSAIKDISELREKEILRNKQFKEEGHIYEAFEDDGYIFLNDLSDESKKTIEDIDFVVDVYEGDGKYQVVNGEYKKI